MKKVFKKIIKYFVLIGFIILGFSLFTHSMGMMGYSTGYYMMGRAFIFLFRFFLLIFLVIGGSWMFFKAKSKKEDKPALPALSKKMKEHYKKQGLSDDDIDFFRETLNQGRLYILLLEDNMNKSPKLRAINMRNHTVKAAQESFKQIVENPKKLHIANHFLYTHLPNLVKATDNFLTIDNYSLKSQETFQKLTEATTIIEQLSRLITQDYEELVNEDLDRFDEDFAIAKDMLNKQKDDDHDTNQ